MPVVSACCTSVFYVINFPSQQSNKHTIDQLEENIAWPFHSGIQSCQSYNVHHLRPFSTSHTILPSKFQYNPTHRVDQPAPLQLPGSLAIIVCLSGHQRKRCENVVPKQEASRAESHESLNASHLPNHIWTVINYMADAP